MKRVIGSRTFDTEKSELLFESGDDVLYRRRNGEFFICDNKSIKPLSIIQAQEWVKKNCPEDVYETIFNAVTSDLIQLSLYVTVEVRKEADEIKKLKGLTLGDIFAAGVKASKY